MIFLPLDPCGPKKGVPEYQFNLVMKLMLKHHLLLSLVTLVSTKKTDHIPTLARPYMQF